MAYTEYDSTLPTGASLGTDVPTKVLANERALREAIVAGGFPGFVFSVAGGTALNPAIFYWKKGTGGTAPWIRATLTWGTTGGEDGNITGITWAYSADGGSVWDNMSAASVLSYDSFGNLTGATNMSGALAMVLPLLGRWWQLYDNYTAHLIDPVAHGMGDMALQDSATVDITGGSITTAIQRTTLAAALGTKSAPFDIDLSLGHVFTLTVAAGAVATFTNKPAAGTIHPFSIRITNGGLVADSTLFPGCKAPGGNLSLQTAGVDILHGWVIDGSTVEFTGVSAAQATL